jgi:hypothetical protein
MVAVAAALELLLDGSRFLVQGEPIRAERIGGKE